MRIGRIPNPNVAVLCDDCHNRAELEINFGQKRPLMLLCFRCGRYLAGVVQSRIGEAERGIPIPKPGTRINSREENSPR